MTNSSCLRNLPRLTTRLTGFLLLRGSRIGRVERFKAMQVPRVVYSNRLRGRGGASWRLGQEIVSRRSAVWMFRSSTDVETAM